jgi:general secretion pathway protein C
MAMLGKLGKLVVHGVGLAALSALAAFWVVKIITPQPTAAPPPAAALPSREPDAVLTARLFGLVQAPQQAVVASNIQVVGVFAAGTDSSAVLVVDGKPARAYRVGQEIAPGTRLAEVRPDVAIVEVGGARQEVRMPPRAAGTALTAGAAPTPAYTVQGNVLGAPAGARAPVAASSGPAVAPSRPFIPNIGPARGEPTAGQAPQQVADPNAPAPPPLQQEAPRQQ